MTERPLNFPCCEALAAQLNWSCEKHASPSECPDALVGRFADDRFGLFIHDGGTAHVEIKYCPWCGARLNPPSTLFRYGEV
jgi:hypothetical protein